MGKKTTKANHAFMLGSFILIILLFLTVFIFLMWAFKAFQKQDGINSYKETYSIELSESTLNKSIMLYINDSLVFSGTPSATMTLQISRFAEENTLLAVDGESDQVSLIPLPSESTHITLCRNGSDYFINELSE